MLKFLIALVLFAHGIGHSLRLVAHGGAPYHTDAVLGHGAREPSPVGVHREAQQQFIADGDEFDVHGGASRYLGRTGRRVNTAPWRRM